MVLSGRLSEELVYSRILRWILLSLLVSGSLADICKNEAALTPDIMKQHLQTDAGPQGKLEAGFFEKDTSEGMDTAACIMSCCQKPLCNVAWFTHNHCFMIECHTAEGCRPEDSSVVSTYNNSLYVFVRSLDETSQSDECSLVKKNDCGDHEECFLSEPNQVTRCICEEGYEWKDAHTKICVPADRSSFNKHENDVDINSTPSTVDSSIHSPKDNSIGCEYGLFQCEENMECYVTKYSKSRFGKCQCVDGFYASPSTGKCLPKKNSDKKDEHTDPGSEEGSGMVSGNNGSTEMGGQKSTTTTTTVQPTEVQQTTTPTTHIKSTSTSKEMGGQKSTTTTTTVQPTEVQQTTTPTTHIKSTSTSKVQMLTVSAGENKVLQLPVDTVSLKAFVFPEEQPEDPYSYVWSLDSHPEADDPGVGVMEGKTTDTLKLSKLIAGLYMFRVQVTGTNKFGEAFVNVSVLPPQRQNKPPVAKITPTYLQVKLPNSAILDGSGSTDDDKIVSYHWEEVSGPLSTNSITGENEIIHLENLTPGNYTFRLTVTDSDGLTNSTTANVTAIKETDYPPKANAGSDVVIHLPKNSVILSGNLSTDDKGIVSYEWTKASGDKLAVNTQGVRTSELHLTGLEVGDYTFTLKVTDSSGQTSTADIHVYVKPEQNTPPIAIAAPTQEMSLPLDNILLDGSNSTDDQKITSYLWQQTGGPTILELKNADQSIATASGEIKVGQYEFKLTVKDAEGLKSSCTTVVNIKQVANEPPVARAGEDVVIQLPKMWAVLDGSRSSDDHKITSYHWLREPISLAAGTILNQSDHQAVLQLVNLVAGRYVFTLTVMDEGGLSSSDTASILVKEDKDETDLLEIILEADISQFTEQHKKHLEGQLALLLPKPTDGNSLVKVQRLSRDPTTGNLRVHYYAMTQLRDTQTVRKGLAMHQYLKKELQTFKNSLDFKVVAIDTVVCQNNCSNHGHCNLKTKQCVCEAFWTQNIFLLYLEDESNCDWSILYVVIVCFLIVLVVTGMCWTLVCCWQRRRCRCRCRSRSKKRHRYSLLHDVDDENDNIEMKKGQMGKIQNSSVMISESDFSSEEEETIFVNQKKPNGHLGKLNGVSKQALKTKMKT